jgi:hypothetical protein
VENENSEASRDADPRLDGSWNRSQELLTGKSIASVVAVALALIAAVIWEAQPDSAPAADGDSAAYADVDADSAPGSSLSATPTGPTESAHESESAPEEEERTEETPSPEPESDAPEPASGAPGSGVYRARQEASGLCMTWGDEPGGDRSVMVLGDCGSTEPELTWVQDGDWYEVEMAFEEWTPCMTVDNGGTEDGMLVGFDGCDGLDAQTWELVPAGGGYQLRTAASSALCLSVLKSSSAESGDAVAVQDCNSGDAKQRWTLL